MTGLTRQVAGFVASLDPGRRSGRAATTLRALGVADCVATMVAGANERAGRDRARPRRRERGAGRGPGNSVRPPA